MVLSCEHDAGVTVKQGRDITWQEFLAKGEGCSSDYEIMESNEPLFLLPASGTTAKGYCAESWRLSNRLLLYG